jgi:hypothetical protein
LTGSLRGLFVDDAETLADFVGVEGVALQQAGDEMCDLGAAATRPRPIRIRL